MFPINPGKPAALSGTLGELRKNHFHSGIDIKTNGEIGWPIYASEDGYVSRVKISHVGYGQAIYITHKNGYTTVYAHLNAFAGTIAAYVLKKQYKEQSYEIELYPHKKDLYVKKGQLIGYSGNSGGSHGPHLHYEIRNADEDVLNPFLFGFKELKDNIPPDINAFGIVTQGIRARVKDEFGRFYFPVQKRSPGNYFIKDPISVWGTLGLILDATDRMNTTENKNGINGISVMLDTTEIFVYYNEGFTFDKTKHINAHIDYATYATKHDYYHRLFRSSGNGLNCYGVPDSLHFIRIKDTLIHKVRIRVWDGLNNTSELNLRIKGKAPSISTGQLLQPLTKKTKKTVSYDLVENVLQIKTNAVRPTYLLAKVHLSKGGSYQLMPSYIKNNQAVYLYDMRIGLPYQVQFSDTSFNLPFRDVISSSGHQKFYSPACAIDFWKGSLFDTVYFSFHHHADTFFIGEKTTPLGGKPTVYLQSNDQNPFTNKHGVYELEDDGTVNYKDTEYINGKLKFDIKNFGTYLVKLDTLPPTVKLKLKTDKSITLQAIDNLTDITKYKAWLNGSFLLFKYDYKTGLMVSESLHKQSLKGELIVEVFDALNNKAVFKVEL